MSDNRRVYGRIKQGLLQLYPKQLTGNQARHLNTLTGMMTGIVQSKRCHFELMAAKAPDESQVASRVKRFSRYTQNEMIDRETYFMPFIIRSRPPMRPDTFTHHFDSQPVISHNII